MIFLEERKASFSVAVVLKSTKLFESERIRGFCSLVSLNRHGQTRLSTDNEEAVE